MLSESRKKIRLYRCCTERDINNGCCLTSTYTSKLDNKRALEELVSHILDSGTGRGVCYSFTTDIDKAYSYQKKYPEKALEICYVDIAPDDLPKEIKGVFPVYLREYVMCLIADAPDIIQSQYIRNPKTGRTHTILGVLNVSQNTVCGWASSMSEVILQCERLQLKRLGDGEAGDSGILRGEEEIDKALMGFCTKPSDNGVRALRRIINAFFKAGGLSRRQILKMVNSDKWFRYAAS